MMSIHMHYMICRCLYHLVALCKKHWLEYIYHLCKCCYLYPVTVLIKYIKRNSCDKGIPYSILLIQKSRICSRLTSVPCPPLINTHSYFFLRVILIHDSSMSCYKLIHMKCLVKRLIPYITVKVRWTSLYLPSFRMHIIMKWEIIHKSMCPLCMAETGLHNTLSPEIIIDICTTADFLYRFFRVIVSNICLITAVLICIKLRSHISATAPVFIADTKEINIPRLLMSILFSEICHRWYTVKCHIFNPFWHFLYRSASEISIYISLAA